MRFHNEFNEKIESLILLNEETKEYLRNWFNQLLKILYIFKNINQDIRLYYFN